jgi:hypothetical protein
VILVDPDSPVYNVIISAMGFNSFVIWSRAQFKLRVPFDQVWVAPVIAKLRVTDDGGDMALDEPWRMPLKTRRSIYHPVLRRENVIKHIAVLCRAECLASCHPYCTFGDIMRHCCPLPVTF